MRQFSKIKQHKKMVFSLTASIIILPITVYIFLMSIPFNEKMSSIILAFVNLLFGLVGTYLVLRFQVWNPACSRKSLKVFCDFFMVLGAVCLAIGLLFQIKDYLVASWAIVNINFCMIGIIFAAYLIEDKYCTDLPEIHLNQSSTNLLKRPLIIVTIISGAILFLFASMFIIANIKQKPIIDKVISEYNSGIPSLTSEYSRAFKNFATPTQARIMLQDHLKEYGKVSSYKSSGTSFALYKVNSDKRYPSGSYMNCIYKIKYDSGKEDYLKLICVKTSFDSPYEILKFGFYTQLPVLDETS